MVQRTTSSVAPCDGEELVAWTSRRCPIEGGWSGHTFLGRGRRASGASSGSTRPAPAGPAAAEIDAAVLRLVRGLVPVPEVLEVRPAVRRPTGPGCW